MNVVEFTPPSKKQRGNFFAVDEQQFNEACKLGLYSALAYLVIASGTGRDHKTSRWSANAAEKRLEIARSRAKAAVQRLVDAGLLDRVDGKRPKYLLALSKAPQWIWLPQQLADGAADEKPPLALIREMDDVHLLRLFISLYRAHELINDGGISVSKLFGQHLTTREGQQGEYMIWAFEPNAQTFVSQAAPFYAPYKERLGKKGLALPDAANAFFQALERLEMVGLIESVAHVFGSAPEPGIAPGDGEAIHACSAHNGEPWERELAVLAHEAGLACLTDGQRTWADDMGRRLVPLEAHIAQPAVLGVYRLRYRPKTMTAAWIIASKKSTAVLAERYRRMIGERSANALKNPKEGRK
jgi:hypothetical protein